MAPNGIELHPILDVVFNPAPNAGQVAAVLPASPRRGGGMILISPVGMILKITRETAVTPRVVD